MYRKILKILRESDGYVSGQVLCEQLGVSRTAVWKSVNYLRRCGYIIDSSTNRGYRLVGQNDIITKEEIKKHLTASCIGQDIYVLDSVDSTNNFAKQLGLGGAKSGIAVAAREQTGGKGRLGRAWSSKKDEGVWFSVLLRPNISPNEVSAVTPLAGIAVCRALRKICGEGVKIKWPNDIIVGRKKICGILTEMSAEADRVSFLVIGIGVNTDQEDFDEEIEQRATSVFLETGEHIQKSKLLADIINELEAVIGKGEFSLGNGLLDEYRSCCASIGKKVGFTRNGRALSGEALDISESGALLVRAEDKLYTLSSGEVTVSGIY